VIPLALFLLACATVFLGSVQAAFSALMRLSLRLSVERESASDALDRYLEDPLRLFIPVRVMQGLIYSLAAVAIGLLIGSVTLKSFSALLASIIGFVMLCEHFLPFLIVRRDPGQALELLLPPFTVVGKALSPVTSVLIRFVGVPRRERLEPAAEGESANGPREEPAAPEPAEPPADEAGAERELLKSVVEFGGTLVREVMTPRPDIVAVKLDATLAELRTLFSEEKYSRLPVYEGNFDNILGFVFVKDLVALSGVPGEERVVPRLLRPPYVVPDTKRVAELLREFQRRQVQMAIVVDEYGGTAGLVTLEDLLEEIVGEIRDEYDVETEPIVDEGNGTFVFSAGVSVDDVADRLGVGIEREGFETVGGFLLSRLGRVPAVGERFDVDGLGVEVLEAERRRIRRVRMQRLQEEAAGSVVSP